MSLPNALTIAGFDPSGGAGVLADARTFAAFGYRPSAVITSITFQNDQQATGAVHQTATAVRGQVDSLLAQFQFACAKTGMLATREVVLEVARILRQSELPALVVDPVMVSSSGMRLLEEYALEVVTAELFPLARLVTPNIPEAEALSGLKITSEAKMREAATIIRGMGARAVLIKGGHLGGQKAEVSEAIDVLDDEGTVTVFRAQFIRGANIRGSGCMLSAAIAAGLGKGMSLEDAVREAKGFVLKELRRGFAT
ncbi:MAG TPA: bifunctional hydroxymethylpyrimidine kinase/phosphomethylpyrimidine kinase [Pyrinomonadaceae bacterium]|nr:bifunctional hydroxymethylpyrimidine kinase/phosphomethylpyrimidine kinase [Pyrinomonadaceae bacterium]